MPMPPSSSIAGGITDSARTTRMFVRYRCRSASRKRLALALLRAERLDDAMRRERLGADVRHVLQRLLAPPRGAADALAQPHERIHDDRRAGQADERQPRVDVEQHRPRNRRARAFRAADRRRSPRRRAAPARRRWTRATAAGRRCCGRRSSPTARGCGRRARRARPSRPAARRPPSGSRRSTTQCPSGNTARSARTRSCAALARFGSTSSRMGLIR